MDNQTIVAGKYGITINLNPSKYVVGWWQIEQDGLTKWLDHMREKSWFTDELSRAFTDMCIDHFNWD